HPRYLPSFPTRRSSDLLELNSQGDYRFILASGTNPLDWLTLIDWTYSPAILSGYGLINTFLVVATGPHFRFYINKQLVVNNFMRSEEHTSELQSLRHLV